MNLKLDTHIADISNLFKWEEIENACLVPHSYGGWPASGALEQIGDRWRRSSGSTPSCRRTASASTDMRSAIQP